MIRSTTAADLDGFKRIIGATGLFPPVMLDAMMAPYLTGAGCADIWLTADETGPVGLLYCAPERMTEGTWNMLLIAVDPLLQGSGRGTALVGALEHILIERGERILLVEASGLAEFAATRAFYAGLDYTEEARIRDFYTAGDDKIIFWKALNPAL